jgi:hypothetical protein
MPKHESRSTTALAERKKTRAKKREIADLAADIARNSVDEAVRMTVGAGRHASEVVLIETGFAEDVQLEIDSQADPGSSDLLKSGVADFSFARFVVALRHGVAEADVTPEFLSRQRKAAEKSYRKEMARYEKAARIKLHHDTPEFRDQVNKRAEALFPSTRK